jgi:tRNA (cmo5U34)-methyltransferase
MNGVDVSSSRLFKRDASHYDALRRALIPCFDGFYGTALDLIDDWHPGGSVQVLDLGAGTGLLSGIILGRFRNVRIRLVDASQAMLDQARQRFLERQDVEFCLGDMAAVELGGPWDLAVSALAIHHLDDDAKSGLFARVREALKPGGLFVNAEQVLGPTPAIEAMYARRHLQEIRAAGVPDYEINKAVERMAHDRCATVHDQLKWLRQAGLTEVDCSFKAWRFAVLSGKRPV